MPNSFEAGPPPTDSAFPRGEFSTPILVTFWRRPEAVARVIEAMRPLRPANLFLACDGPREGNEEEAAKVLLARKRAEEAIDWPCSVQKRYSDVNQGLKHGISNAIDWFFSCVEEGILLEDDTLPNLSFFYFCGSLLERYRHDTRIWQISGSNLLQATNPKNVDQSGGETQVNQPTYRFIGDCYCWGWATWRRCWVQFDIEMKSWPEFRDSGLIDCAFNQSDEIKYWSGIWNSIVAFNVPQTWDYQWVYCCFANGSLSVIPSVNLVTNIGFTSEGSNCVDGDDPLATIKAFEMPEIIHPRFVLRDRAYERAMFEKFRQDHERPPLSTKQRLWFSMIFTLKGVANKLKTLTT